jgi:hypothetical protein
LSSYILVELYKSLREECLRNLDFHFRYNNFYVGLLSAITFAFLVAFQNLYQSPVFLVLGLFPPLIVLLAGQGKLAMFRFYLRFLEAVTQMKKIESALGLDASIQLDNVSTADLRVDKLTHILFWEETHFIPGRYYRSSHKMLQDGKGEYFSSSDEFIKKKFDEGGAQSIAVTTMNIFVALALFLSVAYAAGVGYVTHVVLGYSIELVVLPLAFGALLYVILLIDIFWINRKDLERVLDMSTGDEEHSKRKKKKGGLMERFRNFLHWK